MLKLILMQTADTGKLKRQLKAKIKKKLKETEKTLGDECFNLKIEPTMVHNKTPCQNRRTFPFVLHNI